MSGLEQATNASPVGGVGTTPIVLVAPSTNRRILIIQNVSSVYIGISLTDATPSVDVNGIGGIGTLVLPPGGGFDFDSYRGIPGNTFMVVAASGSANPITVIQW